MKPSVPSLALLLMTFITSITALAEPGPLAREALDVFQQYLRIDTTNPPGREMAAVRFLEAILKKEGIESEVFDLGNDRGNLLARLPGDGSGKAVILLHHMDVVPAEPEHWTKPAFEGLVEGDHIYGRGALDVKAKGVLDLMTFIGLKRDKVPLARDVWYLAVSDEEASSLGSRWMTREKKDLLRKAEFLIDEGGTIFEDPPGSTPWYMVSIAEKIPVWVRLTFKGPAGHGSVPRPDSAAHRLLRAANRLLDTNFPIHEHSGLVDHVDHLLQGQDLSKLPGFKGTVAASMKDPAFVEAVRQIPRVRAAMGTTITLTQLEGSEKINSISTTATLGIDCRLVPGIDPDQFLKQLREIIQDEQVDVNVIERPDGVPPAPSPVDSDFFRALRLTAEKHDPGARIVPHMLTSSTDAIFYRSLGLHVYGFEPYHITWEDYNRCHGNDERFPVKNLEFGLAFHRDFLVELCGKKQE